MGAMMDKLFPVLMLLGFLSPCAAIVSAVVFYARHRNRIELSRRVPAIAFAMAVIVCGAIGGYFGMVFGISQACYGPTASNMCWVWGFFVTGPISFALAVLLVGLALSLVRPVPKPDA
jgi:MFS family permease